MNSTFHLTRSIYRRYSADLASLGYVLVHELAYPFHQSLIQTPKTSGVIILV